MYFNDEPVLIFSPTLHKSEVEGGFRIDGPGPENPPPTAIITALTSIPTPANNPVKRNTFCRGDTVFN